MYHTKKLLTIVVIILSTFNTYFTTFANNTSTEKSQYETKILEGSDFQAKLSGNNVEIGWNSSSADFINDSDWKYWKIVRSSSNSSPVYPEDGYIKYDTSKLGFNSFIDTEPKKGINYYRVCAIAGNIRYCSNVVKVEYSKQDTKKTDNSKDKQDNSLSNKKSSPQNNSGKLLTEAQILLINNKLDSIPAEKKLEAFTKLISRIDELSSKYNAKTKKLLQEIKEIVQSKITQLDSNSLIDDVFSGIGD